MENLMFDLLHHFKKSALSTISFCAVVAYSSAAMDLAPETPEAIDVAIIGGGMAGLTSAYNLNKSGILCHLYEAKEDVGGRTKTHYFNEQQYYELGGTQIDSDHESVIALARKLGVELNKVSYGSGEVSVINKGIRLSNDQLIKILEDSKNVFGTFKEYNQDRDVIYDTSTNSWKFQSITVALDQLSSPEAKGFWETFIKDECGIEANALPITSANWLYDEANDYQMLLEARNLLGGNLLLTMAEKLSVKGTYTYRVNGGMSNLVNTLKKNCISTIFECNHVLTSLAKNESGYHLTFGDKTVIAQNVIMAIPFSTLRDIKLGENFGLTDNHLSAIKNLNYSTVSKIGQPVTGQFEMLAHFNIDQGQQFFSWPGHNAVTLIVGGEAGRNLDETQAAAIQNNIKENFPPIFPNIGQFGNNVHIKNWAKDPFAKGSWSASSIYSNYSDAPSEIFPKLLQYAEPINDNTFIFAGEHTINDGARAHIEGAVQSGEIAAQMILDKRNISQTNQKENCSIQ
jgi:monoamine oxidase